VATSGATATNLKRRRRAAIECDDYFEDWDRIRGVVVHARARFVRGGTELDRAIRLLKRKFSQYRDYDIDEVIALRVERVTSCGSRRTRSFRRDDERVVRLAAVDDLHLDTRTCGT
jgi:hypothetical protein